MIAMTRRRIAPEDAKQGQDGTRSVVLVVGKQRGGVAQRQGRLIPRSSALAVGRCARVESRMAWEWYDNETSVLIEDLGGWAWSSDRL